MKNNKIILFFLTLATLSGMYSCKKESFDINKNPNSATDSTISYNVVLPAAQNGTARIVSRNWGWLQNYMGYWARSGSYAPNTQEEGYELTTSFQSGIWTNIYDNLYDYQTMQIGANKAGATFYEGVARIMKAHNYEILVSIYGNVPYSEALKGTAITTPKYDNGLDIYKDLLRQIDAGIDEIKNADEAEAGPNGQILTDDIMFGESNFPGIAMADMKVKWAQFANTLKLRILTKFMNGGLEPNASGTYTGSAASYVSGVDLTNEFAIIAAEGSNFLDFDAEVQPGYQSDKGNPFYNLYVKDDAGTVTGNANYYKANSYAVGDGNGVFGGGNNSGYYGYDQDYRIYAFYSEAGTAFKGVQYGLPANGENSSANLSPIGQGLYRGVDKPLWIITKAESLLLQAECMNRGKLAGNAGSTLTNAIYASYESSLAGIDVTPAESVTLADDYMSYNSNFPDVDYLADGTSNPDGATGGLFTIISQKWFALNGIAPWEVWADYRRIDFSSSVNHFLYGI